MKLPDSEIKRLADEIRERRKYTLRPENAEALTKELEARKVPHIAYHTGKDQVMVRLKESK